jgi:hypothetical protein
MHAETGDFKGKIPHLETISGAFAPFESGDAPVRVL